MMQKDQYGRLPTVFISSTCYDLKQIRVDLHNFINEQLGYEAILSEFDSFPLEPEISTVENCIRVVRERADIFCLIIGGRYGSIGDSGKSITNLEYINAKAKGIPIYIFVDKSILAILPIWEKNKSGDFSNVVDNPQLFEFISDLRGKESVWMYGFENVQDIIKALRRQLGYLFNDALKVRSALHVNSLSPRLQKQTGKVLKIIMEKPSGWEYLLLGEILEQKINELEEIKSDLIYGFSFGNICKLSEPNDILDFISSKTEKMLQLIGNFNVLFKKAIPDALGAPGEAGDEEKLIYVGERFGSAYESLLRWGMEFKNLSVNEEWAGLINSVSKLWVSPVTDINEYVKKYKAGMIEMRLHLDKYLITDENMPAATIDLTLVLNSPDLSEFDTELEKIRRKM